MSEMKGKPNIDTFISGGDVSAAKKSPPKKKPATAKRSEPEEIPAAVSGEEKITKTFRLSKAMEARLKEVAFRKSAAAGKRVTESDLIEAALNNYLNK